MSRNWQRWMAFGAVAVVALVLANLGSGIGRSTTTYTVDVVETGLATGTSWSATFNGVTNTGTTSAISFTGVAAGSYCWNVLNPVTGTPTTTRYVPTTSSGCITVPNQLTISDVYTKQYSVTFSESPSSAGTTNIGTNWYNAGAPVGISADAYAGYGFAKWTGTPLASFTFADNVSAATELTVKGTGTVTAHFATVKTAVSFMEVGLPASAAWSVVFNGVSHIGTTSAVSVGSQLAGNYGWSVAPVASGAGVQYAPSPASGGMNVPTQSTQEIVFVKQVSVTFATNPTSTGSTYPYVGSAFYTNGTNLPISAFDATSWTFSTWLASSTTNFGFSSKTTAGTNVTLKGPGTLTAKFLSGTECTTCTLTFHEVGLPVGTGWAITFGSTVYSTTTTSITLSGLTASNYWSVASGIGAGVFGVQYYPESYTSSGYWYLGSTNSYTVVYQEEYYVQVAIQPYYYSGSTTISSGWYPADSVNPVSAIVTPSTRFVGWGSIGANLTLGTPTKSSTSFKVLGPETVTAKFATTYHNVHFQEFGLPAGTTWSATIGGQTFWSSTSWVNVTGVADGSYSWSAVSAIGVSAGVEWASQGGSGSITVPQAMMEAVVFAEAFQVTVQTAGTAGGSTSPSGAQWYWTGTVLPLMAANGTSATFSSWGTAVVTGTITLSSTSAPSTFATIKGTGTVTATFT